MAASRPTGGIAITELDVQLVRTVRALHVQRHRRRAGRLYVTAWSLDVAVLLGCLAVLLTR